MWIVVLKIVDYVGVWEVIKKDQYANKSRWEIIQLEKNQSARNIFCFMRLTYEAFHIFFWSIMSSKSVYILLYWFSLIYKMCSLFNVIIIKKDWVSPIRFFGIMKANMRRSISMIGDNIKSLRRTHDLTQPEFAKMVGIHVIT